MSFPTNPTDNDIHTAFGRRLKYKAATSTWEVVSSPTVATVTEAAPTTAAITQAADLPMSGNEVGAMAYVSESNRLYVWNGSGWFEVALVNTDPTITDGGEASYTLASDGTPTVITLTASDPEGVPLTWSHAVTSGSLQDTTVTNVANVFTVTPGSTATTFALTFTASDGINTDTSTSSFSLSFSSYPNMSGVTAFTLQSNQATQSSQTVINQYQKYYIAFNNDGTRMGGFEFSNQGIHYCTLALSPPYSIEQNGFNWNWIPTPTGFSVQWGYKGPYWNGDGTKFFILGGPIGSTTFRIHEYSIGTAYSFAATATFVRTVTASLPSGKSARAITFSENGDYLGAFDNGIFMLYSMSTPWDISTLSLANTVNHAYTSNFADGYMVPNGTGFFILTLNPNKYFTFYPLSTAFDLSTLGTPIQKTFSNQVNSIMPIPPNSYTHILNGTIEGSLYKSPVTAWTGISLP